MGGFLSTSISLYWLIETILGGIVLFFILSCFYKTIKTSINK